MKGKFFLYSRKSTDEADRQVLSIEAQNHELRELAGKEGLVILDALSEAQTAKEPGRPVFNAMLDRVERGEAQGIIAWHPDRLARNSVDGGRVIYLIDVGKLLWLKFPTFWFEPTPQGKFMLNIAFGQSKYFIDNLKENVQRGLRAKVRNGGWPTLAPFGYKNDRATKTIHPDPEKAPFVRSLFELYSSGRYTLEELADRLNGLGISTRRKGSLKYRASNMEKMLTNPIYYGLVRFRGDVHEGAHQPLITKDLFDRVQREMSARRKGCGRKKGVVKDYVFRGLFRCGECGAMITAETQKGHNYYRCTRKLKRTCSQRFLREEDLKEQVRAEVEKVALPEDWANHMIEEINRNKEELAQSSVRAAQLLKDQIAQLEAQLSRLLDLFMSGDVDRDSYQAKRSDLVNRKMELKAELEKVGRPDDERLEPLINFVNWSKQLNKQVFGGDFRAQAAALQKIGSNRVLIDKKIRLSVESPFDSVAREKRTGNWSG